MDALYYYTGKVVWLGLALLAIWLLVEIIIGFANAVSWARWTYYRAKKHGHPLRWLRFPESFIREWFDLIGYRNRGRVTMSSSDGGVWRGIGDWTVGAGPVEIAPFDEDVPLPPKA